MTTLQRIRAHAGCRRIAAEMLEAAGRQEISRASEFEMPAWAIHNWNRTHVKRSKESVLSPLTGTLRISVRDGRASFVSSAWANPTLSMMASGSSCRSLICASTKTNLNKLAGRLASLRYCSCYHPRWSVDSSSPESIRLMKKLSWQSVVRPEK